MNEDETDTPAMELSVSECDARVHKWLDWVIAAVTVVGLTYALVGAIQLVDQDAPIANVLIGLATLMAARVFVELNRR